MSNEVKTSPEAMRTFARSTYDRFDELYDVSARMYVVDLGPTTFGYIPGIGQRIFDSYSEFIAGLHESITATADLIEELGRSVREAADDYEATDEDLSVMYGTIEGTVRAGR